MGLHYWSQIMGVIDIRGTHGSGKSYIVHQLLELSPHKPVIVNGEHLGIRIKRWGAVVLGKYSNQCGGCDGIKTADEVCMRVRYFALRAEHVILEGILVAHTFKRYDGLANEIKASGIPYTFCFLDTPLKVCVLRAKARRMLAGNRKPFDWRKHLEPDYNRIQVRLPKKFAEAGHNVVTLPWGDPIPAILGLLGEK